MLLLRKKAEAKDSMNQEDKMTALERIKEMEDGLNEMRKTIQYPQIDFLIAAFNVMREIASSLEQWDGIQVDDEFEKKMSKEKSNV